MFLMLLRRKVVKCVSYSNNASKYRHVTSSTIEHYSTFRNIPVQGQVNAPLATKFYNTAF